MTAGTQYTAAIRTRLLKAPRSVVSYRRAVIIQASGADLYQPNGVLVYLDGRCVWRSKKTIERWRRAPARRRHGG